jgi:hypothetical protein
MRKAEVQPDDLLNEVKRIIELRGMPHQRPT